MSYPRAVRLLKAPVLKAWYLTVAAILLRGKASWSSLLEASLVEPRKRGGEMAVTSDDFILRLKQEIM